MKLHVLLVSMPLLLMGCATAPTALPIVKAECPRLPVIEELSPDVLGVSFLDRMQNFLSGKLSEPISLDFSLPPARLPTVRP